MVFALVVASASFRNQAGATPAPTITPIPGICDTDSMLDVFGDLDGKKKKRTELAMVEGRLLECSRQINAMLPYVPSPTPSPYWIPPVPPPAVAPVQSPNPACVSPPPVTAASDPHALYEMLGLCVAYIAYLGNLPSPAPTSSPPPHLASHPTYYVFATGAADPIVAAVLIRSTVQYLTKAMRAVAAKPQALQDEDAMYDTWIAGRADWTSIDSFTSQCQLDPNTRGALIIQTSIPEAYRFNYLLLVAQFERLSASVEMLGCGDTDHDPSISPISLWMQQNIDAKAHQTAYTLGIMAAVIGFLAPTKTTTSVSVSNGTVSANTSTRESPQFEGNLLSGFQAQNLNLPAQDTATQVRVASERFAVALMGHLHAFCDVPAVRQMAHESSPKNSPTPPPQYRTVPYKAAYEFIHNCEAFGDFTIPPG